MYRRKSGVPWLHRKGHTGQRHRATGARQGWRMSRREIVVVCELAAHLAYATFLQLDDVTVAVKVTRTAADCASNAMALQRLGRSVWNSYQKAGQVSYDHEAVCIRNRAKADEILSSYGL